MPLCLISADGREVSNNKLTYLAKAFAQQQQFFAAVAQGARALQPQVVTVTPTLGTDWNGESAVFLRSFWPTVFRASNFSLSPDRSRNLSFSKCSRSKNGASFPTSTF